MIDRSIDTKFYLKTRTPLTEAHFYEGRVQKQIKIYIQVYRKANFRAIYSKVYYKFGKDRLKEGDYNI